MTQATDQAAAEQAVLEVLLNAAFAAAQRGDWKNTSLASLARDSGLPLGTVLKILKDRDDVLMVMSAYADAALLAEPALEDADGTPRERLFDVMYRRLEKLQPWRAGLSRLLADTKTDPLTWAHRLTGGTQLRDSVQVVCKAAGVELCPVQSIALIGVYAQTALVWLSDDSSDLGPTMAALDRALGLWERIGSWERVKNIALTSLFRAAKTS